MNRRTRTRTRQKQINILHTTTRKRHSQKQVMQMAVWCSLVLAMIVAVGAGLHFGIAMALDRVLYTNPRYALNKIEIEPRGHFSEHAHPPGRGPRAGTKSLDLEPASNHARPGKTALCFQREGRAPFPGHGHHRHHERVPVVKIVGLNIDLGTRETFLPRPRRRRAQAPRGRSAPRFCPRSSA